jgi:hypothetical protein
VERARRIMAKNILEYPVNELRQNVCRLSISTIKTLYRGIYEFKWEHAGRLGEEQIADIERKETILFSELQRRKYMTNKDTVEFYKWINQMKKKKIW